MAIRKIARMGHPVLREVSRPVPDPTDPEVARLAQDLMDTCEDIGGNGIAAPQIYEPLRMFAFRVRDLVIPEGARMQTIPWTVCVNPTLEPLGEEMGLFWERCLSLPGLYGQARRHLHVRFGWTDLEGRTHAIQARRYLARLLQHEFDHLDGILFIDRISRLKRGLYVKKRKKQLAAEAEE